MTTEQEGDQPATLRDEEHPEDAVQGSERGLFVAADSIAPTIVEALAGPPPKVPPDHPSSRPT